MIYDGVKYRISHIYCFNMILYAFYNFENWNDNSPRTLSKFSSIDSPERLSLQYSFTREYASRDVSSQQDEMQLNKDDIKPL